MRFSELEGRSIGVWGAGREARALCQAVREHLSDCRIGAVVTDDEPAVEAVDELGVEPELVAWGEGATERLDGCDVVVRSPGISIHRPEAAQLRERGIPLTSGSDLWLSEPRTASVVGVTGTKGKSTTASLLAHLLRGAGRQVELAGNVGVPLLDTLGRPEPELYVVELSSYQIADLSCGPDVAVVTNLYREHVDWHGSEERYFADKLRLLWLPGVERLVLNGRDARLREAAGEDPRARCYGVPEGLDAVPAGVVRDGELLIGAGDVPLLGEHNALNVCAALTAAEAVGARPGDPAGALRDFRALAHRLEPVATVGGALWVNDSISTTPESTIAAVRSFDGRPLVLIAGGHDRGQDHAALAELLAAREPAVHVIGLPRTGERLVESVRAAGVPEERATAADGLDEAVRIAAERLGDGAVVLLSPAAASFGAYRDFEQRGQDFRELVGQLARS